MAAPMGPEGPKVDDIPLAQERDAVKGVQEVRRGHDARQHHHRGRTPTSLAAQKGTPGAGRSGEEGRATHKGQRRGRSEQGIRLCPPLSRGQRRH